MKLNFAGRITQFFLTNKPLTVLVLVGTILSGIGAYLLTPKQYNPTITLPAFSVELAYQGATAQEVETFVTRELEEKIADIPGVDTISSRSFDGGKAIIQVQFHIGEDLEESKIKITQKINENRDKALFGMGEPIIRSMDPESVPILTIGFLSPDKTQNEIRLQVNKIMNEIRAVPDVANLAVHGGEKKALKIILNPEKLEFRGITPIQVTQVIQASNRRMAVGNLKDGETIHALEVKGQFEDAETLKKLPIAPGVQLQDVASVFEGYTEKTSFVRVLKPESQKSQEVVFLSIAKRKGSNAILVVDAVQQKLADLKQQTAFKNLEYTIYRDEGLVAQKAIRGLLQNLLMSIVIVSGVLIVFLGFRSAMLVAIAIPLTIGLVFVTGYGVGETINRITLFALILSLGLLVDNATVVVENITRHIQKGKAKQKAIIEAVNEVGLGLFISTVTSVIVFLPTSQLSGMMGEYMGPLSLFVPMALVLSLIVAYVLTPFLADMFLKESYENKTDARFEKISDIYARWLRTLLENPRKKKIFLGIIMVLFVSVLSFPVFKLVHFRMLPTADKEQFFVYIDALEGTDKEQTKTMTDFVSSWIKTHEEVRSIQQFIGEPSVVDFNGFFKGSHLREAPHLSTLRVRLTPPEDRDQRSSPIVAAVRKSVYEAIEKSDSYTLKNTTIKFLENPPGPPVRSTLEIKIQGPDREILKKVTQDLNKKVIQKRGVVDADTSIEHPMIRTILNVDHEKALQSGISAQEIEQTLALVLNPQAVGQYHKKDLTEIAHIEMQLDATQKNELEDLDKLQLRNQSGDLVPLVSLVKKQHSQQNPTLSIDDREPTEYISAEIEKRSVVYPVIEMMTDIVEYDFPEGGALKSWNLFGFTFQIQNGEQYHIRWGGEFEMTLKNFRDLGMAMLMAFILIYIVLVAQFKSFKIPLLIMTTMPLGFIGIMPGFALLDAGWGTFLTATSLIGFIALMGIVVNNAIMYLEYFQILRSNGKSQHEALIEAGKTRLRPILLTSMTTVLGNLTIASDPVWSGLAWAIVFGLSLSAMLTVGVFPLLYEMTHKDSKEKFQT